MKKFIIIVFLFITGIAFCQDKISVVASGYGANESAALRQAYTAAVEQAVGVLVSTNTYIENGRLINEKILTKSNGFIETYEKLYSASEGAVHKVTIKAQVSTAKLNKALVALPSGGNALKIDGAAVSAKILTSNVLYNNAMDELPDRIYDLVDQTISSVTVDLVNINFSYTNITLGGLVPFTAEVVAYIDNESHRKLRNSMIDLFQSVGGEPTKPLNCPLTDMKCGSDVFRIGVLNRNTNRTDYYTLEESTFKAVQPLYIKIKNLVAKTSYLIEFKDNNTVIQSYNLKHTGGNIGGGYTALQADLRVSSPKTSFDTVVGNSIIKGFIPLADLEKVNAVSVKLDTMF